MSTTRRLLSISLLTAGLAVATALPASADHNVQALSAERGGACQLGEMVSPAGITIDGRVKKTTTVDGATTSFTCTFRLPEFVSADETFSGEEFVLPKKGLTTTEQICTSADGLFGEATIVVKGNGKATATCTIIP